METGSSQLGSGKVSRRRFLKQAALLGASSTVLAPILSACQSSPQPSQPAAVGGTPAAPASAPAVQGTKELPFFNFDNSTASVEFFKKAIKEFETENPGVKVVFTAAKDGAETNVLTNMAAVKADIGLHQMDRPLFTEWSSKGFLTPLDDIVKEIGEEDFHPGALFRGEDGHIYAVAPTGNSHLWWINQGLLQKAGVKIPTNYQEVLQVAKAVADTGNFGLGFPTSSNKSTDWFFTTIAYQQGGDYFDRQGNVTFGSPEVLEALKREAAMMPFLPPGTNNWAFQDIIDAFVSGRVAMVPTSGRCGIQLFDKAPAIDEVALPIFPPFGEKVKAHAGKYDFFAIVSWTKNKDEAKKFLKFIITGQRGLEYSMTLPGQILPALKSVQKLVPNFHSPYVDKHQDRLKFMADAMAFAALPESNMGAVTKDGLKAINSVPPWGSLTFGANPIGCKMIQQVYIEKKSPEDAHAWATAEMTKVVTQWKKDNPNWKPPTV